MSIVSAIAIVLIMGWALLPTIDYIDWMKIRKTATVRFPLTGEKNTFELCFFCLWDFYDFSNYILFF